MHLDIPVYAMPELKLLGRCPFTNASNEISIRLASNMPLLPGSLIQISGFAGIHRLRGVRSSNLFDIYADMLSRFGKLTLRVKDGHVMWPNTPTCRCAHTLPWYNATGLESFDELDSDGDGCIREAELPARVGLTFACLDAGNGSGTPGCITRHDLRDHDCSAGPSIACNPSNNVYNISIELDNGGGEQESPDTFAGLEGGRRRQHAWCWVANVPARELGTILR